MANHSFPSIEPDVPEQRAARKSTLLSFLLVLLLAACSPGGVAFTPQQAVVQAASRTTHQRGIVDQNSIRVRQTVETGGKTFVLFSYRQQVESRQEDCLMMYEARRGSIGTWVPGSGEGGCSSQIGGGQPDPLPPLEVGAGSAGGFDAKDPGFSNVHGLVHEKTIVKIRVTWNDSQTQVVPVVEESYLAVRVGKFQMQNVAGLGTEEEVIYEFTPETAPGKQ